MNGVITDTSVLSQGIEQADMEAADELERHRLAQEDSQIVWWFKQIDSARQFDKEVRKGYARDRLAAQCVSAHEVRVPLIGTSIDTMRSFLYARDPSVDCSASQEVEAPADPMPVPPVQPPGIAALVQDPTAAASAPGVLDGLASGGIEGAAMAVGADVARQQAEYDQALALYQQQMMEWQAKQLERRTRKRERQLFAQTLEIVITKAWKKARMKAKARKQVVSCLTVGVGWMKISWQERTSTDPVTTRQLQDLRSLLSRIENERAEMETDGASEEKRQRLTLSIEQQMAAARAGAVEIINRGLCIDFIPAQNIQVADSVDIVEYLDAPWMCEFIYKPMSEVYEIAGNDPEMRKALQSAQRYHRQERTGQGNAASNAPDATVRSDDSSEYIEAGTGQLRVNAQPSDSDYVQIAEVWSAEDQNVYTMVRGVKRYLKPVAPPNTKSERFYGYFALSFIDEDGERSPASMTNRSSNLQDEYNGRRSALKKSRHRARPGIFFDETAIGPDGMDNIRRSEEQEFTGVKTVGDKRIADCFAAKPVSPIIPELYDTSPILRDFERVWGTQEALTGSVEVDKTATEADIQQTGFRSRTGDMRDMLEEMLTDAAQYSAVVLKEHLTIEDVLALAGPQAVWPELEDGEALEDLMNTTIRAGSTGKPNSGKEREAWGAVAPMLIEGATQIGMARGSTPQEIADKQEAILQETANRAGDNSIDIAKFIPQNEGMLSQQMPGQAAIPGAPPAQSAPGPMPVDSPPPSPVESVV